jgi:hypothetical protein
LEDENVGDINAANAIKAGLLTTLLIKGGIKLKHKKDDEDSDDQRDGERPKREEDESEEGD